MIEYAENKAIIAKRIARFFKTGDVVNLGIGLPTMVGNYVPEGVTVILQSENGLIGLGPAPEPGKEDKDLTNAGGMPISIQVGGAFFDSATSFGRFAMPWADIPPPNRVQFVDIKPGSTKAFRGQQVAVSAEGRGLERDGAVTLVYSTADGQTDPQQ